MAAGAAGAALVACAVLTWARLDPVPVLLGAVVAAGAGSLALLAGTRHPAAEDADADLWRWCAAGALALGLGTAAELVVAHGRTAPCWSSGIGFTVGVLVASAMLYQGLVRWNRRRTMLSDPGDWLNGVGAVLCATALGALVLQQVPAAAEVPRPVLAGHLLRISATVIVLGTSLTVAALADLRGDPRSRRVIAAMTVVTAVEVAALLHTLATGAAAGAGLLAPATVWPALVLVLVAASRLPPGPQRRTGASSQATTVGSVVVIASGVIILVVDAVTGDRSLLVPVCAGAGALAAGVRIVRLVRDLALLASSRVEARTDPLTGIANRRALVEAVDALSSRVQGAALLVIDLDRFKDVNDRYGHQVGDEVIRTLAGRLQEVLPAGATLARLGGDEFAVVLEDPDLGGATEVARRACGALTRIVEVDGRVVRVSASVGVASTALGEHRDGELLRCADAAMYVAKRAGGGVRVYDQRIHEASRNRSEIADELRAMLEEGREDLGALVLHYQPQLDTGTGRIVAVEALVRWDHPVRGLLVPAAFLDLAEENGLMAPLTGRVLDLAARQAAGWTSRAPWLQVAVNLSTSCLEYPHLLDVLGEALHRSGLPADRLVVEITETSLMREPEMSVAVTRQIRSRGIAISIDDYGTGYSSLSYLHDLPADELKLDRSFTGRLTTDPRTRAIVSGTIELAHRLGLRVVAEGVEDAETLAELTRLGCDRTQGYHHSRPVPAERMSTLLAG